MTETVRTVGRTPKMLYDHMHPDQEFYTRSRQDMPPAEDIPTHAGDDSSQKEPGP